MLLGDFALGYSYTMTILELGVSNTDGSHEIAINYTFKGIFVCRGSGKQKRKVSSCYLFDPSHGISSFKGKRENSGTSPFMFILL